MNVVYMPAAVRQLAVLSADTRSRVVKKIDFYARQQNPLVFAERLTGFRAWRFRIGTYRVFFEVQDETIFVLAVRKRDAAYRGLD